MHVHRRPVVFKLSQVSASIRSLTTSQQILQLLLAGALRGRRDVSCHPVIATFLAADSLELRQLAQEALRLSVGDQVPFDAHWPRSRRLDAASRLMDLHNRKP